MTIGQFYKFLVKYRISNKSKSFLYIDGYKN
jgi:hypothetical protein